MYFTFYTYILLTFVTTPIHDTIKNGLVKVKQGDITFSLNDQNDTLHGPYAIYYKHDLRQSGCFNYGYRNGIIRTYDSEGILFSEKKFNMGTLQYIDFYTAQGALYAKNIYNDSVMVYNLYYYPGIVDTGFCISKTSSVEGYNATFKGINW